MSCVLTIQGVLIVQGVLIIQGVLIMQGVLCPDYAGCPDYTGCPVQCFDFLLSLATFSYIEFDGRTYSPVRI